MSAHGLTNQNSRLQAAASLVHAVTHVPCQWLFVVAGQVDIDFVYYYRRLLNPSLTFEQQTDTSATRLVSFLESVMEERAVTVPREQVVVHGVHPPPLDDTLHLQAIRHHMQKNAIGLAMAEKLEIPTHRERTAMSLAFNRRLRAEVTAAGFRFADISSELIDSFTGVVKDCFKRTQSYTELEIHLDDDSIAPLYLQEYCNLGLQITTNVAREDHEATGFTLCRPHLEYWS